MDARTGSDLPLPEMVGVAPPEHDIRGRILVLLIYGCGAAAFAGLLVEGVYNGGGVMQCLVMALFGAGLFAAAAYLANGLRRFECWSWFFVVGWLALPLATALDFLLRPDQPLSRPEAASAVAAVMMLLGAIHSLWVRRWDFWEEPRLEALRPRPRGVTPAWRAARLARIGAGLPSLRVPAPTAGALWMRRSTGRG